MACLLVPHNSSSACRQASEVISSFARPTKCERLLITMVSFLDSPYAVFCRPDCRRRSDSRLSNLRFLTWLIARLDRTQVRSEAERSRAKRGLVRQSGSSLITHHADSHKLIFYFVAPKLIPLMMYRWKIAYTRIAGIDAKTRPANWNVGSPE